MTATQPPVALGGNFLVSPLDEATLFTRERFTDDHRDIEKMVRDFASERVRPNRDALESRNQELALTLLREMGELGLLGIDVPEAYGGMELDKITTAIVAESMGRSYSASFSVVYSVQTGIGMLPVLWFGTPAQKERYLPRLVTGEWIGAYALTEPSAGSDALSGKCGATLSEDGRYYLLNGEKQFITNAAWADLFTVFAQVNGSQFSAFLVERTTPGLTVGAEEKKMGVKGSSTCPVVLKEARVPVENLLYEVGKGATIAFNALNLGRFKLAASDLGGSKAVFEEAVRYAKGRRQFAQAIANFDVIKGKVADMAVRIFAADSMIYRTIGLIQQAVDRLDPAAADYYVQMGEATERYAMEASMAKVVGSETLGMVTDHGVQILGGYGFIEEFPMAGPYRDTRIDRIWEGTNEINRQIVAGTVMKRAILEELPIRTQIRAIDAFLDDEPEAAGGALVAERAALEAGKRLALSLLHEALNEFGQDLKHEQQLMELLANMFIEIYTAESTLGRTALFDPRAAAQPTAMKVAQVQAAEASIRLLNLALTGLNGIFRGALPMAMIERLRRFQARMIPRTDILRLKRAIAEYAYAKESYPF
ncbi:MAG TPA: acyl-CoA dehydrogenase [Proteobacteria bacterium]|nr:acyl-CoA dehydrogenase [Pseudomonadota bacterium]